MARCRRWVALAVLLPLFACGAAVPGAAGPERVERATIEIQGDPNGLYWDEAERALLLADDDGNRILRWTDAGGVSVVGALPAAPEGGAGLGQLVRLADGTLLVTRFGHGRAGDVAVLPPQGGPRLLAGLEGKRRRIGLALAWDGALYDAWFIKLDSGGRRGGVSELSLEGRERDVMLGLKKPVGVLVVGDQLFVADQDADQVLVALRTRPTAHEVFARVPRPDLLAVGPEGSLFVGSATGSVYRVDPAGQAVALGTHFRQVRGLAYDSSRRRLFVVDHDADASDGLHHFLHVLPID